MATADTKELQAKQKSEVAASAEQTIPGLVFTPAVDIFETEKEITLVADLPGVFRSSDFSSTWKLFLHSTSASIA